jgi:Clr5 domain
MAFSASQFDPHHQSSKANRILPQKWEENKGVLKDMYVNLDMTVSDVAKAMGEMHHFSAK